MCTARAGGNAAAHEGVFCHNAAPTARRRLLHQDARELSLGGANGRGRAYVVGAVSGYDIMSACGVGELLASYITGAILPDYPSAFQLTRYHDAEYTKNLEDRVDQGQL